MTENSAGVDPVLSEGLGAGAGSLHIWDVVTATFQPQRTDDLNPHARPWIGGRMRWEASWQIDDGPYAGQLAMTPHEPTPAGLPHIGWVPLCDLADVMNVKAPERAWTLRTPADASTITLNGSTVIEWQDKSGNGWTLRNDQGNRPA